jgi:hypothetical protein
MIWQFAKVVRKAKDLLFGHCSAVLLDLSGVSYYGIFIA